MAFLLAKPTPHNVNHDNDRFSMFNKEWDIPTHRDSPGEAWRRNELMRLLLRGILHAANFDRFGRMSG